jgi:hypothetical protein
MTNDLTNHNCAGDNCVCIGGDEDRDTVETDPCYEEDDRTAFDMYDDSAADADALASAGWGTDEDYGCYGGED